MSTTATGTFTHCGTDQFFSLQYTCRGPNCNNINDFPNTTCTDTGSVLSCTNGVTCPGPTNYTSKFTFTQPDTLVSQSYDITYGCEEVLLSNDGTTGGTKITVKQIPGCASNTTSTTSSASSKSTTTPLYINGTSSADTSPPTSGSSTIVTVINGITTTICPFASQHGSQTSIPIQPTSPTGTLPKSTSLGGSTAVNSSTSASPTSSKPLTVTSGALPRHPPKFATIFLLLFSFTLLIHGTLAFTEPPSHLLPETSALATIEPPQNFSIDTASLDLRAVDLTKIISSPYLANFAKLLSEYLNGKAQAAEKGEELFAANLIAEVENAICSHFVSGAITKFAFYDAIEVCIATIITGTALAPPAELAAIFGAGLLCNYLFSELVPGVDAVTNAFCNLIPKPCSADLLSDAKNCGKCGNVCSTGVCKNGACTSTTCTGQTCSTFGPCGPGGTCVCASTAEGTGYCADGQTPCAGLPDCTDSTNCASGTICAVGSCCGRNVCVGATFCGGSSAAAVTPRYLLQRSWTNATLADMGVWVD